MPKVDVVIEWADDAGFCLHAIGPGVLSLTEEEIAAALRRAIDEKESSDGSEG